MAVVYLSLGSNLGKREENISKALGEIRENIGEITKTSSAYETEPWGFTSPNKFINIAAEINTALSPRELLAATQKTEEKLGRCRKVTERYEDRTIDIDILLYDNIVTEEKDLVIPHPKMQQRTFVMEPLAEIAPQLRHPVSGRSVKEIRDELITK